MPEVFYGPWSIEVIGVDSPGDNAQRFVIVGADEGDGPYPGIVGTTTAAVGRAWQIDLEVRDGIGWHRSETRRTATYTVLGGLIVTLGGNGYGGDDFDHLIVVARSANPDLDPLRPAAKPYDFTLPEDRFVRPDNH